jgi:shikimate kinase
MKFHKHIVLIGFKHVGKTIIGECLAKKLQKKFIDVDCEVKKFYEKKYNKGLTCRQIMQNYGEPFYRKLEYMVLKNIMLLEPSVISLGGGTLLSQSHQEIIQNEILLHVEAPRGVVFERIMVDGLPAFFDPNKEPYESFNHLWDERNKIFKKMTPYVVNNSLTLEHAVNEALLYVEKYSYA